MNQKKQKLSYTKIFTKKITKLFTNTFTKLIFLSAILLCSCASDNFTFLQETDSIEQVQLEEKISEKILLPENVIEVSQDSTIINIKTDIPKANVYLNNIYQGKTPLLISGNIPGFYLLSVEFVMPSGIIQKQTFMIEIKFGEQQNYYIENSLN